MNLLKLLPDRPKMSDAQLDAWLKEQGAWDREILAYRSTRMRNPLTGEKEPFAQCTCTACGAQWYAPICNTQNYYPQFENAGGWCGNGGPTICPECGEAVEVAHERRLRRYPKESAAYPWEIIKRRGCILFVCWKVARTVWVGTDAQRVHRDVCAEKRNAYMLDRAGRWHRFTAMERAGWCACSPMVYTGEWYEMDRFEVADYGHGLTLPHPADVYEGTALENAKMERMEAEARNCDRIFYARVYQRYPAAENLAMQCPALLYGILAETGYRITLLDWIDWTKARPHEMLRMSKQEFKAAAALPLAEPGRIEAEVSRIKLEALAQKWGIPKEYVRGMGETGVDFVRRNQKKDPLAHFGIVTTWNYIKRQGLGNRATMAAVSLCTDYWKDLAAAGMADGTRATIFPRNLKATHARVVAAMKYKESKELADKFAKQARRLEPLAWQHDGLCIRPARDESELIGEGKALGHCVGGYGQEHCAGKSIFFVRKADSPDLPYYTLQLDTKTGKVIQNRGEHNCARTEEVQAFEEAWLAAVVKPWIKKKKAKHPAESKQPAA